MRTRLVAIAAAFLWAAPAFAHRLDEYLQATTLNVEKGRVEVEMHLTPGVQVFPAVFAAIDTNRDGILSEAEKQAYARQVLRDLSLTLDGSGLQLRLVSSTFAKPDDMKEGLGDIILVYDADVSPGGVPRKLVFQNHHQSRISVYLVNCLLPRDPDIHITAQNRNYDQSFYQVDYNQARPAAVPSVSASWTGITVWLAVDAIVLLGWLATRLRRRHRTTATSPALSYGGQCPPQLGIVRPPAGNRR